MDAEVDVYIGRMPVRQNRGGDENVEYTMIYKDIVRVDGTRRGESRLCGPEGKQLGWGKTENRVTGLYPGMESAPMMTFYSFHFW